MTENKRFTLAYEKGNWWAVRDGDITLWKEEVVGLLNEQHEENIELKHDNKRLVKFIMSKGYTLKDYLEWLQKEVWE